MVNNPKKKPKEAEVKSRPPRRTTKRVSVMKELKSAIPAHSDGKYLQKIEESEKETRIAKKAKRSQELAEVESRLKKNQQVKFLASNPEVEQIKAYAKIAGQSQSEFIRTAIREKIRKMDAQSRDQGEDRYDDRPEDKLRLVELRNIRRALEKLKHEEKKVE